MATVVDPLGGSLDVEALTDDLEREAEAIFADVAAQGGVVQALEEGWFQRQIAQSAARFQQQVEAGAKTIVGLTDFVEADEPPVQILKVSDAAETLQRERLADLRARRDQGAVDAALAELARAAREDRNVIPPMLDCARAYATLHESRHVLEEIYGAYREPVFF